MFGRMIEYRGWVIQVGRYGCRGEYAATMYDLKGGTSYGTPCGGRGARDRAIEAAKVTIDVYEDGKGK